ncbi:MAG: hypothetical protein BWX63_02474 [Bacteroidetes bacterium ADurb.Bin041]|nr:MAG: hypothetical protein BWX63_02474 [Bacteroidetes bacterium ADurb.Bin041]
MQFRINGLANWKLSAHFPSTALWELNPLKDRILPACNSSSTYPLGWVDDGL